MSCVLALVVACGAAITGTGMTGAAASVSIVTGAWGNVIAVPGVAALDVDHGSGIDVLSCTAPGACGGGGHYAYGPNDTMSFVVDEKAGIWGTARPVPGLAVLNSGGDATILSMSCASPGNCSAGGYVEVATFTFQAWVADETGGVWGSARIVPGVPALNTSGFASVNSLSCASPGNCSAGGSYAVPAAGKVYSDVFVADETNGVWGTAKELPGTDSTSIPDSASLTSVSCTSPGKCVAVGSTSVPQGSTGGDPYVAEETNGNWGTARTVPGVSALSSDPAVVTSVSCPSAGNCSAVGYAGVHNAGFAVAEAAGVWGNAVALRVPVTVPPGDISPILPGSLSCSSAGNCATVGYYMITNSQFAIADQEAFVANEQAGHWGAPEAVPALASLNAGKAGLLSDVSCSAPGDCSAVGHFSDSSGTQQAVIVTETGGTWSTAQPLLNAAARGAGKVAVTPVISCAAVAHCSVGGYERQAHSSATQAVVANEIVTLPTTTTVSPSAANVIYGHEQTERVTVSSRAATGSVTGTAVVKSGRAVVCTVTLVSGRGSCTVPAAKFGPGAHPLTAFYGGATGFSASVSATKTFTVVKATSKAALTLSAGTVRFGHEQAEKLTVRVTPQFAGAPGGTVTVKAGSARVCVIALRSGAGSCTLTARQLGKGTHHMAALYAGNPDFKACASPAKTLTVTR